jgi:hypothetical protein
MTIEASSKQKRLPEPVLETKEGDFELHEDLLKHCQLTRTLMTYHHRYQTHLESECPEHPCVTNRRPRLAATTIIQRRSLIEPARSPVCRQDRPDSSPVDPEVNVSKQGKVSRRPQTVWRAPCIDPAHLPNPDSYPICHQTLSYHLPHLTPPSWLLSFPASFPHPFLDAFDSLQYSPASVFTSS